MSPGGKEGPRDWDKELAEIDKLIAAGAGAQPAAPATPGKARVPAPAGPRGGGPPTERRARLFTWIRLLLALTAGVAMTQWPYVHGCGVPLFGYLAAVGGVIAASLWSLVSSWRTRSGFAHFLSIGLLFWGAVLAAREILPRVGYAKEASAWLCPAAPTTPVPQPRADSSTAPAGAPRPDTAAAQQAPSRGDSVPTRPDSVRPAR